MEQGPSRTLVPDELPAEFAAFEAAARAALVAVGGADRWPAALRGRVLGALDRVVNAATVARGKVITAERDAGTWALKGDRDLPAFLGRVTRQGRGAGFAQVGQAATLAAMPQVADALVDGPVTPKHLQEITRVTGASPLLAAELASAQGQAKLVELAGRFDGAAFGRKVKQLAAGLDPAARQREHDEQQARRYLTLTHTVAGTEIRGLVDSVAGYKLQKAIDARNPRPAQGDTRPRDQRQADALAAIVEQVLTDRQTTPGAVAPVQALVTFSEGTWLALRAARRNVNPARGAGTAGEARLSGGSGRAFRRETASPSAGFGEGASSPAAGFALGAPSPGSMADVIDRLRGAAPVTDEDGRAWPASEIGRALCDCALTRAVLDANGQPLDLGNAVRLFNRAQWLAIFASGQTTCAVNGCDMPLRYSQLHHMDWWERDDGPTDLANCAPECTFHHGDIHRNDIRVTRLPDGTYEHRWPDGRPYGGAPPSGGSPLGEAPPCEATASEGPFGGVPSGDGTSGGVPSRGLPCDVSRSEVSSDEVSRRGVSSDEVSRRGVSSDEVPHRGVPSGGMSSGEAALVGGSSGPAPARAEQAALWSV